MEKDDVAASEPKPAAEVRGYEVQCALGPNASWFPSFHGRPNSTLADAESDLRKARTAEGNINRYRIVAPDGSVVDESTKPDDIIHVSLGTDYGDTTLTLAVDTPNELRLDVMKVGPLRINASKLTDRIRALEAELREARRDLAGLEAECDATRDAARAAASRYASEYAVEHAGRKAAELALVEAHADLAAARKDRGPSISRADARELLEMSDTTTSEECYARVRSALCEYAGGDFECHNPNPLDASKVEVERLTKERDHLRTLLSFAVERRVAVPAELRERIELWLRTNANASGLPTHGILRDVHAWLSSAPTIDPELVELRRKLAYAEERIIAMRHGDNEFHAAIARADNAELERDEARRERDAESGRDYWCSRCARASQSSEDGTCLTCGDCITHISELATLRSDDERVREKLRATSKALDDAQRGNESLREEIYLAKKARDEEIVALRRERDEAVKRIEAARAALDGSDA